jgi:cytochrome c oxidase subunit IV
MAEPLVSKNVYYAVFAALLVLTFITIQVASIDLGPLNTIVALTIAVCKALLVALYFMHVRYSSQLTWVVAGGGLFWLGILIILTMSDYLTRGWLALPGK